MIGGTSFAQKISAKTFKQPAIVIEKREGTNTSDPEVSFATLLKEMVNPANNVEFPTPFYRSSQVSSYDRSSVVPGKTGWFADDDGFGYVRLEIGKSRCEKVLFDEEGPGAVTRIWLTTSDKRGTLRFYFDHSREPQILIPAYDMSRFPLSAGASLSYNHTHYKNTLEHTGGNTFYLPIPYARHLKITLEEHDPSVRVPHYYQIGYRTYIQGTKVKSFSLDEMRQSQSLLQKVNNDLQDPPAPVCKNEISKEVKSNSIIHIDGKDQAVNKLSIRLKEMNDEQYRRVVNGTRLQISFDGTSCVESTLAHFFGGGDDSPQTKCWYFENNGKGWMECWWVMPFKKQAEIRFICEEDVPFEAMATVGTADYTWTSNTLYFHATSKTEKDIKVSKEYNTLNPIDWNFITIDGRGVYVGDMLAVNNKLPNWFGEGDERIYVDSEPFPSFMGTGLEDYYNCSWAPVVPFLTPFGGVPRAHDKTSHGKSTWLRTRNTDAIPFNHRLHFDFEMEGWSNGTVDYSTVSF
ncbi:MAG: DUF2961 domain-containing protein [Prevotella sp.]|nr:DUF2961 domain-containing protein [Prevotella sp.]